MSGFVLLVYISCLLGVESFPHQDTSLGITGGHAVNITEAPFMARYRNLNIAYMCGAVIVHPHFLLTSAFCHVLFETHSIPTISYITVGTNDVIRNGESHNVSKSYPHPKYRKNYGLNYDIAVLQLDIPLEFNERVNAVQLAEEHTFVPAGSQLDIFGFGAYNNSDTRLFIHEWLQKVTVPYIDNEKCLKLFSNFTDLMICTYQEGLGTCVMDEGGPLLYENKLVGVASYTAACGTKDDPNIFTFIPAMLDFIRNITGINA